MGTAKLTRRPSNRSVRYASITLVILGLLVGAFFIREQRVSAPLGTPQTQPANNQQTEPDTTVAQPPNSITPDKPAPFNKNTYSTVDPNSLWVVVNKQHPLQPIAYAPSDLVGAGNGQVLRSTPAAALSSLLQASASDGNPMSVLSGYRSYATQSALYNNYVRTDGQASADTYSARPGHSEHQTGLAVDVGNGTCNLLACFGDTAAGKWLANNAHTYGFIIRYPSGQSRTTGYQYEPWHLRYVGTSLANEMRKQKTLTLEEFFGISGGTNY